MNTKDLPETLYVNEEDLEHYFFTLKRGLKIREYWKRIVRSMPRKLNKEVKSKLTDLICGTQKSAEKYKFSTRQGSKELNEFLSNYKIVLKK